MKTQLKRALNKCTRFREDEVHAYCTPTEYFLIREYLEIKEKDWQYEWVLKDKQSGNSSPTTHYFKTTYKKAGQFPESQYYHNMKTRMIGYK